MATIHSRAYSSGVPNLAAVVLALALIGGCSSGPVKVAPEPPTNPKLLGTTRGSGCGLLLFDLLPMGVNGRLERARREAQLANGMRDVTDVKVVERWYGIPLIGAVLCTDIEETAVQ